MNIALIGYGKMGKTIEKIAVADGHTIVARIDKGTEDIWNGDELKQADVAIEFSQPESAYENILKCFQLNIPIVCGTTGWLGKLKEVQRLCKANNQSFFYASNYSIGVNIFFELNKLLAELMNKQESYDEVLVHESHHIQKLDAPSGTAISLAEQILEKITRLKSWSSYKENENIGTTLEDSNSEIPIFSSREGDVPGTHIVKYFSDDDEIEIIHKAFNRQGFAKGALAAAVWLHDKKGSFGMKDLLSL